MRLFQIVLICSLPCIFFSQVQAEWMVAQKISLNNYGYCISTGPEGNIYVSGSFTGAYRNPGPEEMGGFISCFDTNGSLLWHKEFYSLYSSIRIVNAVDSKGNVIIAGPFLLRYKNDGSLIDTLSSQEFVPEGLCIDREDNIILAGIYPEDSVMGEVVVEENCFFAKYDYKGNKNWEQPIYIDRGPNQDFDVTIDNSGNIYATGGFGGSIELSNTLTLTSKYRYDGFAVKFNPEGKVMWARSFGGEKSEFPRAITADRKGNIYISGTYNGILVAESYSTNLQQGVCDLFLIKYDNNGVLQWLKSGGGEGLESVPEMMVDEDENIFLTGRYNTPTTFKWGDLSISKTQDHYTFLYLLQIDSEGNGVSLTSSHIGGAEGRDVNCDNKGNIYLTGGFGGVLDFAGKTLEGEGMFLMKLSYDMNNKVGLQEESSRENLFHIFPNPGKEIFNISFSDDLCPDASILVYETSGRCILKKEHVGCDERNFQCAAPPGVYLVELRSGAKRQTRKVIIQ